MHLYNILFALMAMLLMARAAPVEGNVAVQDDLLILPDGEIVAQDALQEPVDHNLSKLWKCPNGWKYCGVCAITDYKRRAIHTHILSNRNAMGLVVKSPGSTSEYS